MLALVPAGEEMLESADYRSLLLTIVDAFLEGTPVSLARAHSLTSTLLLFRNRNPQTLDSVVWGGYVSMLIDFEFYESEEFLRETRAFLAQGSPNIHRAYLNFDYRSDFTPAEHEWLEHLLHLLTLLRQWRATSFETDTETYNRHVAAIVALGPHTHPPTVSGDETLHHYVLRHVSEVLTHIDLRASVLLARRLTPTAPCTLFGNDDDTYRPHKHRLDMPDATTSVEWADRALRAITHREWMFITWQVTATSYHISLH